MIRASLALAAALIASGCAVGIGQECSSAEACPEGLVCSQPTLPGNGGTSELGFCDYPPLGEGEPCTRAAECQTTLTCSIHFTPNGRYGECVPRRESGEACFANRDCLSNRCRNASGTAVDGNCQ